MKRILLVCLLSLLLSAVAASPAQASGWKWPLQGPVITSYRNGDDPYADGQHRGIDIAGGVGDSVVAAAGGTVRFAAVAGSSGLTVSIRTADGRYDTSYLHLSSIGVHRGDRVRAGARIGAVGTSGRRSAERPHLHFGVRDAGSRHAYHDPLAFLPPPASRPRPEVPHAAPAPVPAPVRTAPAPVRVRAPGARAVPAPRRHGAPAPRPGTLPALSPSQALGGAHRSAAARPGLTAIPGARSAGAGRPAARPAQVGLGPSSAPAAAQARAPEVTRRPAAAPAGGGADLSWALACVGLLLAAACLGGTQDGRAATARGKARIGALLQPLVGRN